MKARIFRKSQLQASVSSSSQEVSGSSVVSAVLCWVAGGGHSIGLWGVVGDVFTRCLALHSRS